MAAPTVLAESNTTQSATGATTYVITVPAATPGDVLECKVGSTSNGDLSVSSGTGWSLVRQWKFAAGLSMALFRKAVATGSDSLTVGSSASARFSAITQRYPIGTRVYASPVITATATGTNSNPPIVNHLKSRDCLYEAWRVGAGTVVPSASPSGYGATVNNTATASGVSTSVARLTATSSSEDPGTFTVASALWGCVTIAHWLDTAGPSLDYSRSMLQAPARNPVILAVGTSNTSGCLNAAEVGGGGMGNNAFITSRPSVWASGMTALPAAAWMCGNGGLVTATNTSMAAYNNRFSAGSSMSTTDQAGTKMIGKGAPYVGTGGQKVSQVIPQNFDRVKVWVLRQPGGVSATIDVNGGATQSVTEFSGTLGVVSQTFSLSGSSGDTVNITPSTGGGAVVAIEAYTNGTYQTQIFNAGWFAGNSLEMADTTPGTGALNGILAFAPDLTILETNCNDGLAGFNLEQVLDNARLLMLAGLASGDVLYSMWPFTDTASEGSTAFFAATISVACDEVGAGFFNVQTKTGFTSRAANVAAGYTATTDGSDAHQKISGYAAWGNYELAAFDPGPMRAPPFHDRPVWRVNHLLRR